MATKIRLARRGRKKRPVYDIVVADSRAPRDGKFIEKLGSYNPSMNPKTILLNEESAFNWVMTGAEPTEIARKLLSTKGIMYRKHLQVGVNKGAITQEEADKKFDAYKADKSSLEDSRSKDAEKSAAKAIKETAARRTKLKEEADAKVAAAQAALIVEAEVATETEEVTENVETASEEVVTTTEEAPAEKTTKKEEPVAEAKEEEAK